MRLVAKSFPNLLLQLILTMAVLLGLPTYLAVARVHYDQLLDSKSQELKSLANSVASVLAQNLKERSREITLQAQTPLYVRAPLDSTEIRASLMRIQKTYPMYSWVGVADLKGTVRSATQGMLEGKNVSQRAWFQEAQKGLYVGDLHEATLLSELLRPNIHEWPIRFIDFAAPIVGEDGALRGVLGSHVHWSWAGELIQSVTPSGVKNAQIEIFLVNQNNEIIFPELITVAGTNLSVLATDTTTPAQFISWGGDALYLTAGSAIPEPLQSSHLGWKVVVRQPKSQVIHQVLALEKNILFIIVASSLVFGLLAWWVGTRVGQPIRHLAQVAQDIAAGRPAQFDLHTQTAELEHLNQALRTMSQSLLEQRQALESLNRDLEAKVVERTAELSSANKALGALTRQDALTGLANRLAANQALETNFKLMKRHLVPYSVLCMDIDFFKKVNDTYGHATGDDVLRHVATILAQTIRETDVVARVGGEEFLAILPMTTLIVAGKVAEKIRTTLEAGRIEPVGQVTMSIGVAAATPDDDDAEVAVRAADQMLYEAKREGRNRVKPTPL